MNKITGPLIALALSLPTTSAGAQESVQGNKEQSPDIKILLANIPEIVDRQLVINSCSPLENTPYIGYATIDTLRENEKKANFTYTSVEEKELWEIAYNDYLCKLQKYTSQEEFIGWSNKLKQLLDIIINEGLDPKKVGLFNDLGREIKDRIAELKNQKNLGIKN